MADNKQPIIIKKVMGGGHAAAHGGAWKVAYADFVTAMMAFFLVMWLMGSDEETKQAVSSYFNNPATAWRKDLESPKTVPLGDRTGSGDNLLNGANGKVDQSLADKPAIPIINNGRTSQEEDGSLDQLLSDESIMKLDLLKLSIPEKFLFDDGVIGHLSDKAIEGTDAKGGFMKRLGRLLQRYKGNVSIRSSYSPDAKAGQDSYEFQLSRTEAIKRFVRDNHWASDDQVSTSVLESPGQASADEEEGRKIEFTLYRDKNP